MESLGSTQLLPHPFASRSDPYRRLTSSWSRSSWSSAPHADRGAETGHGSADRFMSHFALVPVSEIGFPLFGVSRSDLLRLLVAAAVPPSAYTRSCCASPDGGSVSGGGRAFSSYAVRLSEAAKATLCLFSRRKSIYAVLGNSSSVSQNDASSGDCCAFRWALARNALAVGPCYWSRWII